MFNIIKKTICMILSVVMLIMATLLPMTATAQSAGDLFKGAIGDVSVTRGGALHSQARSIYSLGGGSVSSSGKSITLFSADGPSFKAGCAGISWHFGGFSFISGEEIQKMIESISQAALGLVIDLAMNVLCPQCYAVMGTMREMANKMRNASMDSCSAAKALVGLGREALTKGGLASSPIHHSCAAEKSAGGKAEGVLGSLMKFDMCGGIGKASEVLGTAMADVNKFLGGKKGTKTPDGELLAMVGNVTYETLTAMGYPDGPAKNLLLSFIGMDIYFPGVTEGCASTLAGAAAAVTLNNAAKAREAAEIAVAAAVSSSAPIGTYAQQEAAIAAEMAKQPKTAEAAAEAATTVAEAAVKAQNAADTSPTETKKGFIYCPAPPLISDVSEIAKIIMCGFNPSADNALYVERMADLKVLGASELAAGSLARMCGEEIKNPDKTGSGKYQFNKAKTDPMLYDCKKSDTMSCTTPKFTLFSQQSPATAVLGQGAYTGLAWLIMDNLMQGVADVKKGEKIDKVNPPTWLKLVQSSDYPLYRVINLAAVYPGQAASIIDAYGTTIAAQHVMQALQLRLKVGNDIRIGLDKGPQASTQSINNAKGEIAGLIRDAGPFRDQALRRLREKQALVDFILQMNKALQAEVMSQGLMGNANMAVSVKNAASKATSTKTASAEAKAAAAPKP